MKPAVLRRLLAAALLLAAGVILGRTLAASPSSAHASTGPSRETPTRPRPAAPTGRVGEESPRSYRSLETRFPRVTQDLPIPRGLQRLALPALKELITSLCTDYPAEPDSAEGLAHRDLLKDALLELHRREGIAAIGWAETLPPAVLPEALLTLLLAAGEQDLETAKPAYERLRGTLGDIEYEFVRAAMRGAVSRGADEALRAFHYFGATASAGDDYPDDFDFAKFHAGLAGKRRIDDAVRIWATRDKEAAWQAVIARVPATTDQRVPLDFSAVIAGAAAGEGEETAVSWAMARLRDLPQEQRALLIPQLDAKGLLTPAGITTAATAMQDWERNAFAQTLIPRGDTGKTIALLETMPRADLMDSLARAADQYRQLTASGSAGGWRGDRFRRLFQESEQRFTLTEAEKSRLAAAKQ